MHGLRMGAREWALLILLSLLWGGSFFFVEVALRQLGPLTVVLGRVGLGAMVLWAAVLLGGRRMPADLRTWGALAVMGAINNAVPFTLIVWGQTHIEGGLASILNATTPLFTVVLAHLFTRDERLTGNRAAGVLVGFLGVVVLIGPAALQGLGTAALAQLAVLGAACAYAFGGIHGRRLSRLPAPVAACGMLTSSALMMLPPALVFERPGALLSATVPVAAVAGLALLSTACAYLIYFRILAVAGATNLLLVTFLIPVSALMLGTLLLGEEPGLAAFAGLALIFAGLALVDGRLPGAARAARRKQRVTPL